MKALRQVLVASLYVAALATGVVRAASTTDFSDQWWVAGESGWGAAVLQQSNTLFIDLMVYGTDGKPTWFVSTAPLQTNPTQGHTVFVGDLYATTGPYYGAGFNPSLVTSRKVGTLAFDATAGNSATLNYTVDGVPVVKSIVRQTWTYENLSGTYDAIWRNDCGTGAWHSVPLEGFSSTIIRHSTDNRVTMSVSYPFYWSDDRDDLSGTYTQSGQLGQIAAELTSQNGAIVFSEIAKTTTGFTARFAGRIGACQVKDGRIVAVLTSP
jgi:hypothetical protein